MRAVPLVVVIIIIIFYFYFFIFFKHIVSKSVDSHRLT